MNFIGAAVFSVIGFFYVRSRGKGVAGIFIPRRKRAERDFLKIAREQSLEESENKGENTISKERIRWKEDFLYTELCFYVQKVLFFYGFREYFHKQNDRCFTILWKFDEKVRGNYCILVKKDWSEIK